MSGPDPKETLGLNVASFKYLRWSEAAALLKNLSVAPAGQSFDFRKGISIGTRAL